ncbi:MAG: hypothetical protein LIP00_06900 [Parabacteroides sp.]|nr:hypothetical protein [Parabacteroides sp.]
MLPVSNNPPKFITIIQSGEAELLSLNRLSGFLYHSQSTFPVFSPYLELICPYLPGIIQAGFSYRLSYLEFSTREESMTVGRRLWGERKETRRGNSLNRLKSKSQPLVETPFPSAERKKKTAGFTSNGLQH